jgi:hypothetical protein
MARVNHFRRIVVASLFAAAVAKPVQHRFEDGEDGDDTPLPLVIWHGKRTLL